MPGNWQFSCCCRWEYLQEESIDHPGSAADKWFKDMQATYSEDLQKFPHIGCGSTYVPYKKGPSMVCEIQLRQSGGQQWEAFLADHTPQALDDQLKKVSYDALSKAFQSLTPETSLSGPY